jgi:hypothetical protein
MPSKTNVELVKSCKRYYESCLWNSTVLFIWLRWQRRVKVWVTVVPIVLGSTPGVITIFKLLTAQGFKSLDVITSILSFLSGMTPLVYNALKLDEHMENCKRLSAEYTNLRDRFRTVAEVSVNKSIADFESDVRPLIERIERAREVGLTTPEWAYKAAEEKIKLGHYDFEVDNIEIDTHMSVQLDTAQATTATMIDTGTIQAPSDAE